MKIENLICICLFCLVIILCSLQAMVYTSAADYEPDTTQVLTEPRLNDITYFPPLPQEYKDLTTYPYRVILKDKNTGNYTLFLLTHKVQHLGYYDRLISYNYIDNGKDGLGFYYDTSVKPYKWEAVPGLSTVNLSDKYIKYNNFDIENNAHFPDDSNLMYKTAYVSDWTQTSLALGDLQRLLKNNLSFLVPFGILILGGFFGLKMLRSFLGIKNPEKQYKMRMSNKIKGRRGRR